MFKRVKKWLGQNNGTSTIQRELEQEVLVEQEIADDVRIVLDSLEFQHVTKLKKAYAKLPDGYEEENKGCTTKSKPGYKKNTT